MPRTKPTPKLGIYGKYDLNPEHSVGYYNESKLQTKNYIKLPNWDIARSGLELTSIKNEKQYLEMKLTQDEIRKRAIINGKLNEQRLKELHQMQSDLRDKLISVNDFIRDCETKEKDANAKIILEQQRQVELSEQIEKIKKDLTELGEFHIKLVETCDKFKQFETVIDQVIDASTLYKNRKDLIDRCDALMLAQVEITEMQQQKMRAIEQMKQMMIQASNEAAQVVMGLQNKLAELERDYNAVRVECLKWEKIMSMAHDCIIERETLTFRLLDQIQQIYYMFCKRNGDEPKFKRDQVEEQLDYIKTEIEILQDVIRRSRDYMEDNVKSTLTQPSSRKKRIIRKK